MLSFSVERNVTIMRLPFGSNFDVRKILLSKYTLTEIYMSE